MFGGDVTQGVVLRLTVPWADMKGTLSGLGDGVKRDAGGGRVVRIWEHDGERFRPKVGPATSRVAATQKLKHPWSVAIAPSCRAGGSALNPIRNWRFREAAGGDGCRVFLCFCHIPVIPEPARGGKARLFVCSKRRWRIVFSGAEMGRSGRLEPRR